MQTALGTRYMTERSCIDGVISKLLIERLRLEKTMAVGCIYLVNFILLGFFFLKGLKWPR